MIGARAIAIKALVCCLKAIKGSVPYEYKGCNGSIRYIKQSKRYLGKINFDGHEASALWPNVEETIVLLQTAVDAYIECREAGVGVGCECVGIGGH